MKRLKSGGGWRAIWYSLQKSREMGGIWKLWQAMRSKNACKTCALGIGGQKGGMVNEAGSLMNKFVAQYPDSYHFLEASEVLGDLFIAINKPAGRASVPNSGRRRIRVPIGVPVIWFVARSAPPPGRTTRPGNGDARKARFSARVPSQYFSSM